MKGTRVLEFKNVHTNWVKQVAYYGSLRSFISSSRCSSCSLLISDLTKARTQYRFKVNMGISCFTFCEGIFSYIKSFYSFTYLFIYYFIYIYLFRNSIISNWWTRLHSSNLEPLCNKKTKFYISRSSRRYLRLSCSRRW